MSQNKRKIFRSKVRTHRSPETSATLRNGSHIRVSNNYILRLATLDGVIVYPRLVNIIVGSSVVCTPRNVLLYAISLYYFANEAHSYTFGFVRISRIFVFWVCSYSKFVVWIYSYFGFRLLFLLRNKRSERRQLANFSVCSYSGFIRILDVFIFRVWFVFKKKM